MVDRVFGSKDEIEPPFLFYSSKGGYENKRKATDREEDEGLVDQLGDRESSNWEQTPGKRLRKTSRAEKAKKPDEEGSSKGLINVLDKQVKLLQEAEERDDKIVATLIQLEEKSEERQKEILMAIINKL